MTDSLSWAELIALMRWPLIATLILPWLLVYLGLHVVQRGVIFVDLALAQTAALGTCVALLIGYDLHDWQTYPVSFAFTLVGAVILTFTRTRHQRVPQEALIGILYVFAAAAAILVLSKSPGESHELQRSLVGELLVVPPADVWKTFALFAALGIAHYLFRKKFTAISADPHQAAASGINVRWWDFIFYLLFGLAVTSFVHIGGVLLVFSYLVVPAACASLFASSILARFAIGWVIATLSSGLGLFVAGGLNLPIGAAIVCVLGLALVLVALLARLTKWFRGPNNGCGSWGAAPRS